MADESRYVWEPLKRAIDKRKGWWAQRLEDSVAPGIPDVNLYIPGQEDWWIELKHVEVPRLVQLTNVHLGLRRAQYIWLTQAFKINRNAILLARVNDEWWIWTTPIGWAMAKNSSSWGQLMRQGLQFETIDQILDYMK